MQNPTGVGGVQETVEKDFQSEQEVLQTNQQIREESMAWHVFSMAKLLIQKRSARDWKELYKALTKLYSSMLKRRLRPTRNNADCSLWCHESVDQLLTFVTLLVFPYPVYMCFVNLLWPCSSGSPVGDTLFRFCLCLLLHWAQTRYCKHNQVEP